MWPFTRKEAKDKASRRERLTKREQSLTEGFEAVIKAKDKQITALERVVDAFELLEKRGIVTYPDMEVPEGADLVDGVIAWIKDAEDIPRLARGPIIAYLTKRKPELNALATSFLDSQMKRLTERPETPKGGQ